MTGEEAKTALLKGGPVMYKDMIFKRIHAIRYTKQNGKIAVSLELLDRNDNSICVVPIKEANLYQK